MRIIDSIISEIERETATAQRVLEGVPDEMLDGRPHPKSMSLGQLAQSVAAIPGGVANMVTLSSPNRRT